jgi:hypothetical protein
MTKETGEMIANVDDNEYARLLAATRPGVISDDAELERLTDVVNRLVTKGIKQDRLSAEEEKLLALITHLIEEYEQQYEMRENVTTEAA